MVSNSSLEKKKKKMGVQILDRSGSLNLGTSGYNICFLFYGFSILRVGVYGMDPTRQDEPEANY